MGETMFYWIINFRPIDAVGQLNNMLYGLTECDGIGPTGHFLCDRIHKGNFHFLISTHHCFADGIESDM
ncbi:Uncharacterised protein [Yersinia enterocolitica]|nr:Uncharacterised protein [Yersinia enterocolitica]